MDNIEELHSPQRDYWLSEITEFAQMQRIYQKDVYLMDAVISDTTSV